MGKPAPESSGPTDSARALGASVLALLRVRVELLAVELKEEAERRKRMLRLAVVAAIFLQVALLLVAFLVIVFFWDTHRMGAIVGVTLLYAIVGAEAVRRFRDITRNSPPAFSATLAEFQKDLGLWQRRDE